MVFNFVWCPRFGYVLCRHRDHIYDERENFGHRKLFLYEYCDYLRHNGHHIFGDCTEHILGNVGDLLRV